MKKQQSRFASASTKIAASFATALIVAIIGFSSMETSLKHELLEALPASGAEEQLNDNPTPLASFDTIQSAAPSAPTGSDGQIGDAEIVASPVTDEIIGNVPSTEVTAAPVSDAALSQSPGTVRVLDTDVPYIYAYGISNAPEAGCGIWKGVSDVDDGDYCYFVGHNPGDFYNVMNLVEGDTVSVCDDNGNVREYTVHDVFTIAQRTTFQDIQSRVEGYGESVVLQTCCGDNVNVRVVIAY